MGATKFSNSQRFDPAQFDLGRRGGEFDLLKAELPASGRHDIRNGDLTSRVADLFDEHAKRNGELALVSRLSRQTLQQVISYLGDYDCVGYRNDDHLPQLNGFMDRSRGSSITDADAPDLSAQISRNLRSSSDCREDLVRILCHYELSRSDSLALTGGMKELHQVLREYDSLHTVRQGDAQVGHIPTVLGRAFRLPNM